MSDIVRALSVLEVGPVWSGSSATAALSNMLDLAEKVERFGYHRYWIAEHHNAPCLAATATPVIVDRVASVTSTIRVGSGGVLLPNHPPLVVAEQFGTLEAFHPGRIDLGIGRAPGADARTAAALRRSIVDSREEFRQRLDELMGYFATHSQRPGPAITAGAAGENRPPVWLLGSSVSSAGLAAESGLPYAFAHQINPSDTEPAMREYRERFQPSPYLDRPYSLVAAVVIAAGSDAEAQRLAAPYLLGTSLARTTGRLDPFPDPEETERHDYSAADRDFIQGRMATQLIGGPETVRQKAEHLVASTGSDELMALTLTYDHTDRVRSYQLLADTLAYDRPDAGNGATSQGDPMVATGTETW